MDYKQIIKNAVYVLLALLCVAFCVIDVVATVHNFKNFTMASEKAHKYSGVLLDTLMADQPMNDTSKNMFQFWELSNEDKKSIYSKSTL